MQVGAAAGIGVDADAAAPWRVRLLDAAPDAAPHLDALIAALERGGGTVAGSQGRREGNREDADLLWAFEPQHLPAVEQLTPYRLLNHIPGKWALTALGGLSLGWTFFRACMYTYTAASVRPPTSP